jgi:hypothetical protein
MGDLTSLLTNEDLLFAYSLKRWLKSFGLIFIVYSVCATATSPERIRKLVSSLIMGGLIGAFFVVFYAGYPDAYNPFQTPEYFRGMVGEEYRTYQALGPFEAHDLAGGLLGFTVVIGYFMIRLGSLSLRQIVLCTVTGLMLLGLLVSGSRSGWVFVLVPVAVSILLSKHRMAGVVLLILIVITVMVSMSRFEVFQRRVELTMLQATSGSAGITFSGRVDEWRDALAHPGPSWLFFGIGFSAMKGHPHSNYIGALVNTGLIGIIFWICYYKIVLSRVFWLMKNEPDPGLKAIFTGIFWAYIGYFFFFLTSTPMMWALVRNVDFFIMGLACVRFQQLHKQEYDEPFAYDEYEYESLQVELDA